MQDSQSKPPFRAVFFGTPEFAVPCLDALVEVANVCAVVCQPDRPAGRGRKLRPPPVKERALSLGLEVHQPVKVRTSAWAEQVRGFGADVALVVAYGRILTRSVLEGPRLGCVNVHASLLPRWRGAAPIQHAITAGDTETGVCLMQMDEGMDTGPVLSFRRTPIDTDEAAETVSSRLMAMGAELVRDELPRFVAGELSATPQDDRVATLAPLLTKQDGALDFRQSATAVHNRVRGMRPWPGSFLTVDGQRIKIHASRVLEGPNASAEPGVVVAAGKTGIDVSCSDGLIRFLELQPEGKRRMTAQEFLAGYRWSVDKRLDRG